MVVVDIQFDQEVNLEPCLHLVSVVQMHSAVMVLGVVQVFHLKFVLSSFLKEVVGKCTKTIPIK